jgi:hypothetical protein
MTLSPGSLAGLSRLPLLIALGAAALAALQPWLLLMLGEANPASLASLATDPALSARMFAVLLAFMPAMFLAYWLASLDRFVVNPALASLALFTFAFWFALELLPRAFDLWVVQGRWLPRFLAASEAGRAELESDYSLYRDASFALGFVRRLALTIGQSALALAVWRLRPWGLVLAIALSLSLLRLLLGTIATYGGFDTLSGILAPMYFVTAGLTFPSLALWCWSRSRASS